MNDSRLIDLYKKDLQQSETIKQTVNSYVSKCRQLYEGKVDYTKTRGSTFVSREIFKQIEWAKAQYKHPFVSNDTIVRLAPMLGQINREFSSQSEDLLNYFYVKKFNRYNFMTDAIHTLLVEGTLIVRTGWEYEGVMQEVEEPVTTMDPHLQQEVTIGTTKVLKEVPIINKPTASIVKSNDIYIDPTATDVDSIQYIIHRREVTLHELKEAGIYSNLDQVKKDIELATTNKVVNTEPYANEMNPTLTFNNEDPDRKKIEMYEYWGLNKTEENGEVKPIVCCWIGDTIIRLEDNPYPDKKIPYLILQFIKEPHTIWGKSLAELLEEHQRIKTGIIRGIFDDLAQSNNTQKGVKKGNLDPVNYKRFLAGQDFEYNLSPNDFYQGSYNRIPAEVFKVLQDVDVDKQLMSGILPMQGGQGTQAIYGSQASKSGAMNSLMLKELDVVNNLSDNLIKPLLMKWLVYMYDLLDPEEITSITGKEYIKPDNNIVIGFLDNFTVDISTQQTDEIKSSELAFLMQTLGQSLPFEMTKLFMSEIAKLKKMPNLAQQIMEYQPQPDPYTEQMKQLQLQKAQLELQLMQMDGQADAQLKQAKAKEADAKATNVATGTIKSKYGIDYQQKMKELEMKHQLDLQKLQEQYRLKQQENLPNNVGITQPKHEPVNINDIQNQTI